jgi:hypothetical protein
VQGVLKPARDYNSFKSQLERVPTDSLPGDKRYNPLAGHPLRAVPGDAPDRQLRAAELIHAMEVLLDANVKLVSSDLEEAMVLQQALVEIVGLRPRRRRRGGEEPGTRAKVVEGSPMTGSRWGERPREPQRPGAGVAPAREDARPTGIPSVH